MKERNMAKRKQTLADKLSSSGSDFYYSLSDNAKKRLHYSILLKNPTDAVAEIQRQEVLIQRQDAFIQQLQVVIKAADEVINTLRSGERMSEVAVAAYEREQDRLAKLNPKFASETAKARADEFKRKLEEYVRGRISRSSDLSTKELVDDVLAQDWAVKNKRRDKYDVEYLTRLIRPILRVAKADKRAARL